MKRIAVIDKSIEEKENIANVGNTFMYAYIKAIKTKNEFLDLGDFLWDGDVEEFLKNLDQFEITDITISDQSTALMRILKDFCDSGWSITGMVEVNSISINWETGEHERITAIKLHKN